MLDSTPLVLKRPYVDLRGRLEAHGLEVHGLGAPSDPVWILLLSAVFAATAALSFLAVVVFGAPGSDMAGQGAYEVRLKAVTVQGAPSAPPVGTAGGL